jgi:hypothetical protein
LSLQIYRILNKILHISVSDEKILSDNFWRFAYSSDKKADVVFLNDREEYENSCYGLRYLSGKDEKINHVFFSQKDRRQMLYSCKEDCSEWRLQLDADCSKEILAELLMAGFYSFMSLNGAVLMHASAVSYKGRSIIFTAASGVGKTTQAELWKNYRNADIINGDKVFLTKTADKFIAWGSPWSGSSPYAENIGVEASAIIVLEQAEENRIRKLSGMEMLEKILPHVFFPNWDARCEKAVFDLLDEILERMDIYQLSCRPDEDAVALTENTIFR